MPLLVYFHYLVLWFVSIHFNPFVLGQTGLVGQQIPIKQLWNRGRLRLLSTDRIEYARKKSFRTFAIEESSNGMSSRGLPDSASPTPIREIYSKSHFENAMQAMADDAHMEFKTIWPSFEKSVLYLNRMSYGESPSACSPYSLRTKVSDSAEPELQTHLIHEDQVLRLFNLLMTYHLSWKYDDVKTSSLTFRLLYHAMNTNMLNRPSFMKTYGQTLKSFLLEAWMFQTVPVENLTISDLQNVVRLLRTWFHFFPVENELRWRITDLFHRLVHHQKYDLIAALASEAGFLYSDRMISNDVGQLYCLQREQENREVFQMMMDGVGSLVYDLEQNTYLVQREKEIKNVMRNLNGNNINLEWYLTQEQKWSLRWRFDASKHVKGAQVEFMPVQVLSINSWGDFEAQRVQIPSVLMLNYAENFRKALSSGLPFQG